MKNKLITATFGVCVLLFALTCAIGLPIYSRWFYFLHLKNMNLEQFGYTYDMAKEAFNEMMNYLTLPFFEFGTGEFAFSESGKAHFEDCKTLFNLNLSLLLLSALGIALILIFKKKGRVSLLTIKEFPVYFYVGIFGLFLPLAVGIPIAIDTESAFDALHYLFFHGKSNWLLKADYDEIIRVLPFEYFINCAIFIAFGLIVFAIVLILLGVKKRKSK